MNFKAFFTPKKDDIFNLLPDALLILNEEGKVVDANEKAVELFAVQRFSIIGEYASKFFGGGSNLLNEIVGTNKAVVTKILSTQNGEKYAEITASADSDMQNIYVSLREVTEKYLKQNAINGEFEVIKNINDEKNTYLTNNSAEILSYASSIESFSRALLNGVSGTLMAKQEKYVNIINKNSRELLYDLEKFFTLLKVESDLWKFNYRTFDIVNMLNDCARKYMDLFKAKKIRFDYDFSNISTRTCYLDPTVVEFIIDSLLEISHKNMEVGSCTLNVGNPPELFLENKKIELGEDAKPKSYILFELKDSSIGIGEEELSNLFNPYKLVKSLQRRSMGTKMTYAIIKKLLNNLGGDIWVYSKPSQGTMTTFVIPVERIIQKI